MSYEFKQKSINPHFNDVFDVEPQDVLSNISDLKLIDVREPSEFTGELGHIDGSELVVLSTLPEKLSSLSQTKPIVFICRSGSRSAQASAFALSKGLTKTYNMRGGMILWNQLSLPIQK